MMRRYGFLLPLFFIFPFLLFGQTEKSSGTGFFVSGNGIIITCAHVIEEDDAVKVRVDGSEYDAQIVTKDSDADLAVLKINYANPYFFKIQNFGKASLGDKVYVLGFPLSDLLGSDIRLTDGIISAKSGINSDKTYFQISAPVQPGNSGGPVLNSQYEVIGVAAAKLSDMATLVVTGAIPQNINFGIKSEYIGTVLGKTSGGNGNVKTIDDAVKATVQILCYETKSQTESTITIINNTGYVIYYVYISPATSDNWGDDIMGDDVLLNSQSVHISLPASFDFRIKYDIMLRDSDSDTYTKPGILIQPDSIIEFTIRDLD